MERLATKFIHLFCIVRIQFWKISFKVVARLLFWLTTRLYLFIFFFWFGSVFCFIYQSLIDVVICWQFYVAWCACYFIHGLTSLVFHFVSVCVCFFFLLIFVRCFGSCRFRFAKRDDMFCHFCHFRAENSSLSKRIKREKTRQDQEKKNNNINRKFWLTKFNRLFSKYKIS